MSNTDSDHISPAMEDYLEAILLISQQEGAARISKIARSLNIAAPSVTEFVGRLMEKGLVKQEKYGPVTLTAEGRKYAENIIQRHRKIKEFLIDVLGVDPYTAESDACQMEHGISPETMERLLDFLARVDKDKYRHQK